MSSRTGDGRRVTLRGRLLVSTLAVIALALAAAFVWARRNLQEVLVEQIDETLANKHRELAAVAQGSLEALNRELHREIEVYERVEMTVRADFGGGRVLVAPDDYAGRRAAQRLESLEADGLQTIPGGSGTPALRVYLGALPAPGERTGRVAIAVSMDRATETLRLFDRRVLFGGLALCLISIPAGLWLYRQALRPVTGAVMAARSLDPKDLSARLPETGAGDELDQLSRVINELLAKLQRHHARVTQFTAEASHELRTPLAAMRMSIEVALQRPRDAEQYQAALEALGDQCEHLSAIVEKLQLLARADAGQLATKQEPVDLGALVRETIDLLSPLGEERDIVIESDLESRVLVAGDRQYLRQVLVNLIDNALKFSPNRGTVRIAVQAARQDAVVAVADHGQGIREEEVSNLFERFYRSPSARTAKGSGLGLSICRSIVEAHGGTIAASSRVGEGSVFTVALPRLGRETSESAPP